MEQAEGGVQTIHANVPPRTENQGNCHDLFGGDMLQTIPLLVCESLGKEK
jgi:hypothetical protein